jgi:transcriptional regulator with XRE-family HTH domain
MATMTHMKQTPLGSEIRRLRDEADVSQEWLAERLGITREAVSAIERGKTKVPGDEILTGLERHLGLKRQRAFELMGGGVVVSDDVVAGAILRIGAMSDPQDRLRAFRDLPPEVQQAMRLLMSDLFLEAGQQLQEASEPS